MFRIGIKLLLMAFSLTASADDFPEPSIDSMPLEQSPIEPPVEAGFLLRDKAKLTAPAGPQEKLAGSIEVRCKASWNDSSRFRTWWRPEGGWEPGQRLCRATVTPLEGPNKNAGAGWAKVLRGSEVGLQLGCRATGGSILDQYRSWIRARIDVYTVQEGPSNTSCSNSGSVGSYY